MEHILKMYKATHSPFWAGQLAYLLGFEPDMEIIVPPVTDKDMDLTQLPF